jgi:hypothetical protein
MKTSRLNPQISWLAFFLAVPLLVSCSSKNNSASEAVSVCTTFGSVVSLAESKEDGMMQVNRILGGSETQINPTPLDAAGVAWEFATIARLEGITYDSGFLNAGAIEKFLDVAGQCLSEDTYQYFLNYTD